MSFLLVLLQFISSITIKFNDNSPVLIELDIIENQIVQGHFKAIGNINSTFEVSIRGDETNRYYFAPQKLETNGTETAFSFNTNEPDEIGLLINPTPLASVGHMTNRGKLELALKTRFDTFDKETAKDVKIKPAMQQLLAVEKLLKQMARRTSDRVGMMHSVQNEHRKLIMFVVFFSLFTLGLFAGINAYEVYSFKRFLKRKKLI
ncbi:hypothetical protein TCON_0481 [Astathelohania contejeani]|uniref:GOLD domain-containing protein n=1 Tax=Astathelohania contejeani TaxID=164912 RepID=A0ABQ7I1H2_9MICR|nr:hypothetical protein TCON_0481 [Thelohania contejeani]